MLMLFLVLLKLVMLLLDGVAKAIKLAGVNPDILKRRPKPASSLLREDEEYTCDVVVVGGGGAGLSAAATAVAKWLQVLLLLRNIQQ